VELTDDDEKAEAFFQHFDGVLGTQEGVAPDWICHSWDYLHLAMCSLIIASAKKCGELFLKSRSIKHLGPTGSQGLSTVMLGRSLKEML